MASNKDSLRFHYIHYWPKNRAPEFQLFSNIVALCNHTASVLKQSNLSVTKTPGELVYWCRTVGQALELFKRSSSATQRPQTSRKHNTCLTWWPRATWGELKKCCWAGPPNSGSQVWALPWVWDFESPRDKCPQEALWMTHPLLSTLNTFSSIYTVRHGHPGILRKVYCSK